MIICKSCHHSCQTGHGEELDTCPCCKPDDWRIYVVRPNHHNPHPIERAIARSPFRVFGRCFLTPQGMLVPLHMMRPYERPRSSALLRRVEGAAGGSVQSQGRTYIVNVFPGKPNDDRKRS